MAAKRYIVPTWGEGADKFVEQQKLKEAHPEMFRGLQTGWRDFDKLTGGIQLGTSTFFIGESKMGKTAAELSLALNLAKHYRVVMLTMEMTNLQLLERGMANMSFTDMNVFRDNTMDHDTWARVDKATAVFHQMKGGIAYGYRDLSDISAIIEQEDPEVLIVDYFQLLSYRAGHFSSTSIMWEEISHYIKNLTLPPGSKSGFPELDAAAAGVRLRCLISASQTTKESKLAKRRVTSSSGRGTSAIEDDHDYLLAMNYVPGENGEPLPDVREMDITSRRSASGTIKLHFNQAQARFDDWDDPVPQKMLI